MNIGSLYTVKKYFWLIFPTKETAPAAPAAAIAAVYCSKELKCEVTYFSPDCYIVFLEEEDKWKKVLTSDGRIGWTWFTEEFNDCFEVLNKHLIG